MNDPGPGASDAELAAYYDRHRPGPGQTNGDEWMEPEEVDRPPRLDVTISVRFSRDEIAAVRERAAAAGLKPTTYIRRCVLAGRSDRIDPVRFARGLDALSRDLDELRRAAS